MSLRSARTAKDFEAEDKTGCCCQSTAECLCFKGKNSKMGQFLRWKTIIFSHDILAHLTDIGTSVVVGLQKTGTQHI